MPSSRSIRRRVVTPLVVTIGAIVIILSSILGHRPKPGVLFSFRGFTNYMVSQTVGVLYLSNATALRLEWTADTQVIGPGGWHDLQEVFSFTPNPPLMPHSELKTWAIPPKTPQRWRLVLRCQAVFAKTPLGRLKEFFECRVFRRAPWREFFSPELPIPNQSPDRTAASQRVCAQVGSASRKGS